MRLRVIGAGRAGTSLARALEETGWEVVGLLGRDDPIEDAARDVMEDHGRQVLEATGVIASSAENLKGVLYG